MFIPPNIIKLLQEKDCEELAVKLGMKVNRHKALCFLHSETEPSLSFHPMKKNLWHCFSCGKGGNAINFMMEIDKCNFTEACEKLCNIYGITLPFGNTVVSPKKRFFKPLRLEKNNLSKENNFDVEIAEWMLAILDLTDNAKKFLFEERKLKKEIVTSLGIKALDNVLSVSKRAFKKFGEERCNESGLFGKNGYLPFRTPCLIFPYRDKHGKLIGLQSRYLGQNKKGPRFQFLSGLRTSLFNMPILNEIADNAELYITEGVTDCLAMLSWGLAAVAIPSATIIPEADLGLLKGYNLKIMPDNDEAGLNALKKLRISLAKKGIRILKEDLPADYKDFGEFYQTLIQK